MFLKSVPHQSGNPQSIWERLRTKDRAWPKRKSYKSRALLILRQQPQMTSHHRLNHPEILSNLALIRRRCTWKTYHHDRNSSSYVTNDINWRFLFGNMYWNSNAGVHCTRSWYHRRRITPVYLKENIPTVHLLIK